MFMLIISAMLVFVLAACGNNKNAETPMKESEANAATAPADSEELTVKHKLGEAKVKKNPQKVVVFDFGILDTLDKLGVKVTGVPQANIPPYLSKYADKEAYKNVGSLKEPDFEKINALNPDLIIISGRQSDAYEELNKIAPTVYLGLDTNRFMDSFKENMNTVGQIFGKEDEIKTELEAIDKSIAEVHDKAAASGKKALIVLANEGKLSAYGPKSRFGIIHDVLGFAAADDKIEVSTHGQSVTSEYVAEKNPDYLFVVDRGAAIKDKESASAKETVENDLVKNTNAFKDGHIVYLDPNYWYLSGGGLLSVQEMVKEIGDSIK
ncbi:siderophore ABC transporter substrate-binding protein [Paenibacillus azoreducens]|nr:siderophore ABC transporter substrate-binding protein [Paenibacillus azoreducens]